MIRNDSLNLEIVCMLSKISRSKTRGFEMLYHIVYIPSAYCTTVLSNM
jgi:hypothetical protein